MILNSNYDKFIGMKVLVNRSESEYKGRIYSQYDVDQVDTTINQIKSEAALAKLHVRLWLPMSLGTMDIRIDRLNVHVNKMPDDTYEVTSINLG